MQHFPLSVKNNNSHCKVHSWCNIRTNPRTGVLGFRPDIAQWMYLATTVIIILADKWAFVYQNTTTDIFHWILLQLNRHLKHNGECMYFYRWWSVKAVSVGHTIVCCLLNTIAVNSSIHSLENIFTVPQLAASEQVKIFSNECIGSWLLL